jgi:ADP-L-glycero-D-manno-heptose 6-epimerase
MSWLALTGVNGFIGHNLALELLFPEFQNSSSDPPSVEHLLGIDLESSQSRTNHARLQGRPGYHYVSGLDAVSAIEERTATWGEPPLAVIHNGACSSTAVRDANIFRVQNVKASQQLFAYCARQRLPYLYASSASVYGRGEQGFSDAIEDNRRYTPLNMYGRSKHEFDSWVLEQKERPPVWFGMRYFNVFGPFEQHKAGQASIFHWGREQILASGRLKLYQSHQEGLADGHQRRDFVPVQDVSRVTWALLRLALQGSLELPESGLFVNIGRGQATSWLEIGEALFEALEQTPNFEFVPMPESLRDHYQNYTRAELGTLHSLGVTQPFLEHTEAMRRSLASEARFPS